MISIIHTRTQKNSAMISKKMEVLKPFVLLISLYFHECCLQQEILYLRTTYLGPVKWLSRSKCLLCKIDYFSSIHRTHNGSRKLSPMNCLLTSTHMQWLTVDTDVCPLISAFNNAYFNYSIITLFLSSLFSFSPLQCASALSLLHLKLMHRLCFYKYV